MNIEGVNKNGRERTVEVAIAAAAEPRNLETPSCSSHHDTEHEVPTIPELGNGAQRS